MNFLDLKKGSHSLITPSINDTAFSFVAAQDSVGLEEATFPQNPRLRINSVTYETTRAPRHLQKAVPSNSAVQEKKHQMHSQISFVIHRWVLLTMCTIWQLPLFD